MSREDLIQQQIMVAKIIRRMVAEGNAVPIRDRSNKAAQEIIAALAAPGGEGETQLRPLKLYGVETSTYSMDTTDMAVRVSDDAKAEIKALDDRARSLLTHPSFFRPIGMQDVRLRAGEGKLTPTDVLAAVNAELASRALSPEPVAWRPDRESVARIIDPLAWGLHDDVSAEEAAFIGISTEMSLTKADRVLALTAPSPKGGA